MTLDIFLPTYKRPGTLQKVATNIEQTTHNKFKLYFGLEKDDLEGIKAARKTGHMVIINKYEPGYANTIQSIYESSQGKYWFHANDDFVFLPDWDKVPIERLRESPGIKVIGCHDGNPDTNYWTISMVCRNYITRFSGVVDMPDRVFYPYNHNYIDTEFTETAITRGVWSYCTLPCIEHHHPSLSHLFGAVEDDATYQKNNAKFSEDTNTYFSRRHLFV